MILVEARWIDLGCLRRGQVSALKENVGIGISANIAPLQSDIKEQKVGNDFFGKMMENAVRKGKNICDSLQSRPSWHHRTNYLHPHKSACTLRPLKY